MKKRRIRTRPGMRAIWTFSLVLCSMMFMLVFSYNASACEPDCGPCMHWDPEAGEEGECVLNDGATCSEDSQCGDCGECIGGPACYCSSDASLCDLECDECDTSGPDTYNCYDDDSLCTEECDVCDSGSCVDDDSQDTSGAVDGDCGYCQKCSSGSCVNDDSGDTSGAVDEACGYCQKCSSGSCVNDDSGDTSGAVRGACGYCNECFGGSCVTDDDLCDLFPCIKCNKFSGGCSDTDDSQDTSYASDDACGYCRKCSGGSCVSWDCSDEDCTTCNTSNGFCDPVTTCYHIEIAEWVIGDCECNYTSLVCEGNETHCSLPELFIGGPGRCKHRLVNQNIGTEYDCEEGDPTDLSILDCIVLEAVELAQCGVQCGLGLANCVAVLYGAGDPAVCSNDFPACMDCLSELEIDCGCLLYPCENGDPLEYVWQVEPEVYGGTCP